MRELFLGWANEHSPHEEGVVGTSAHNADIESIALVPPGKAVNDIDAISGVEVVDGAFSIDAPDLRQ